jgi:hypothetical protein
MLNGLLTFMKKLVNWRPQEELEDVLIVESKDIVNAVKLQLSKGIDGNGEKVFLMRMGGKFYHYARRTVQRKDMFGVGLGAETDRITNYQTGAFYNSIFVEIFHDGSFQVLSTSPLINIIKARSGDNIINLNPESEMFLFEAKMAPLLQQEINELFLAEPI